MGAREVMALIGAALLLAAPGCSFPRFAPPGRLAAGTMPEPVTAGTGTARVTMSTLNWYPIGGEARAEYGVNDDLTLDLGVAAIFPNELTSALGGAGFRFHAIDHPWFRLAVSVGLSLGAGGGGLGDAWSDSFAMSTTLGLDLGVRFDELFGLFLANRYELSTADDAPTSHWGLHLVGAQLDLEPFFFVLEGGVIYVDRWDPTGAEDGLIGPFPWFGLSVGVRIERPARSEEEAP